MLEPGAAPIKIDVWRRVRHPPPDMVHSFSVKGIKAAPGYVDAGHPATLVGKVMTWVWSCADLPSPSAQWRVRVDVQQGGRSVENYPAEYWGPLPEGQPLAQLKISEVMTDRSRS
jgi:hypothetical protein